MSEVHLDNRLSAVRSKQRDRDGRAGLLRGNRHDDLTGYYACPRHAAPGGDRAKDDRYPLPRGNAALRALNLQGRFLIVGTCR